MTHILTALLIAIVSTTAAAQSDQWVEVANNSDMQILMRKGSIERSANKAGEQFTSVVGQWVDKRTRRVDVLKFYVTDNDCDRGFGELTILTMQNEVHLRTGVTIGGQSIGSDIAGIICQVRSDIGNRPAPQSSRPNPNAI